MTSPIDAMAPALRQAQLADKNKTAADNRSEQPGNTGETTQHGTQAADTVSLNISMPLSNEKDAAIKTSADAQAVVDQLKSMFQENSGLALAAHSGQGSQKAGETLLAR